MPEKTLVFIISGKSPLEDSGGYPAYAHTLSHALYDLHYYVHTISVGSENLTTKGKFTTVHSVASPIIKFFPVLRHLALAGLPLYSVLFAIKIAALVKNGNVKKFYIWGMGPWALCSVLLKFIIPKGTTMIPLTSYFTSTRHEMKGALDSITLKDYGLIPKLRYFFVYHIVARIFHVLEKITLNSCKYVVVHYQSSRAIVQKYFDVPDSKLIQFPWYSEIFVRQVKNAGKVARVSHPLIVSICRQDPRKGLNFLIRAVEHIHHDYPTLQCLIIGTGSFLQHNKNLVKKLGLTRVIQLPGFVPDVIPILKLADIVVIVPLAQGSSALTVGEAMSYGKAIVVSDCDGIPEDITDGKTGIIVKKANSGELAFALKKLLDNPKLRKRLGNQALLAHTNRFGFSKMKMDIDKFLHSLGKNDNRILK